MARQKYRAVLADLDGTINRGDQLIPGAAETYSRLSEKGVKWIFVSNSARRLAHQLAEKINRLGLSVSQGQVINSASALLDEISRAWIGAKLYVVGEPPLVRGIADAGGVIDQSHEKVDIVVVAMDSNFNYDKLNTAFQFLRKGALFWATNLDTTFPTEGGFVPGSGAIVAAISAAIGRQPDKVFGKPHSDMARLALRRLNLTPSECLVVGDRMDTDVLFARNSMMDAALVFTGATTREHLLHYNFRPEYLFDDINGIQELFEEENK